MADGAVLFAPDTEIYFGLNEVGSRIWQLMALPDGSFDTLCAELASHYPSVTLETIRQDVRQLLDELVAEGLAIGPGATERGAGADSTHPS
jgi:hypothetical protein